VRQNKADFDRVVKTFQKILDREAWVFYVTHKNDGSLEFLSKDHMDAEDPKVKTSIQHLVSLDSRLQEVAGLPINYHAYRLKKKDQWYISKIPSGDTHYFLFEARVDPKRPSSKKVRGKVREMTGVFVNAWIKSKSMTAAQAKVKKEILSQGFVDLELQEYRKVTEAFYEKGAEGLTYYNQVQIDGEVYCFNNYWGD
jgi:hypothetical protein